MGYFHEFGIGTQVSRSQAIAWYKKAAELGDESAKDRLKLHGVGIKRDTNFFGKECSIM